MTDTAARARYVIVSPVRDEEQYIELTLRSVGSQTHQPALWVIVNDSSTDLTPEIIRYYASKYSFMKLVDTHRGGVRQPGTGVIAAFQRGCADLRDLDYDFIVKLDCDLSFEPDYFEKILQRFHDDERLGIASGTYAEANHGTGWVPVPMPSYHAFGACKVVRRACFDDIGGFATAKGWDTVDEIHAWDKGWKTQHFLDLETRHHKPEGSRIGLVRTSAMHGHIYYVTGGDPLFLVFKFLHRLSSQPIVFGGIALLWGYFAALASRAPRLVTRPEMRVYRKILRERLWMSARKPFASDSSLRNAEDKV